jgi:CheY-like chemotaxis protein
MEKNKFGKILIVDDSFEDRETYKRILKKSATPDFSISIVEAQIGREAMDTLRNENPDCILLDYMLPDMTGLELLSQLKETHYSGGVIMLTGEGEEKVAVEAMKKGVCDYLVKDNHSSNEFLNAIAKAINISWSNKKRLEADKVC